MLPIDPEEAAALAVLDRLGRHGGPDETAVPETEDVAVEGVLRRLHEESLALLAFGLEPQAPSAGLRERLLATAAGDETQDVSALVAVEPGARDATSPAPGEVPDAPSSAVVPFDPLGPVAASAPEPARRASRPWAPALAAVLALVALGLGLWSGYLLSELRADRARLAWAETEWRSSAERLEGELAELRARFDRVTAASVVYPLHCPTGRGPAAGARAYLWAPPGRHGWEFAVHGLDPEPPGREYQVWFLVGDEPKSGGCFRVRDGEAVFRLSQRMPEGVTGVAVSIEPAGGSRRPSGEPILVADRPVRL